MKLEIESAVKKAVQELYRLELTSVLEHPKQESFGDYASPVALEIARQTGSDPLEIASQLKLRLEEDLKDLVQEIQVEKPGFLNFWLKDRFLLEGLGRIAKGAGRHGSSVLGQGKTLVVDFFPPNIV